MRGRLDLIYPEPTDLTGPQLTDAQARRLYGLIAEAIAEQDALKESPSPAPAQPLAEQRSPWAVRLGGGASRSGAAVHHAARMPTRHPTSLPVLLLGLPQTGGGSGGQVGGA